MINLYSTGCPKCKILEMKLKQKNIDFNEISDLKLLLEKNILNVPVLEIDGNFYDFSSAVKLVNEFNNEKNATNFGGNEILTMGEKDYGYKF